MANARRKEIALGKGSGLAERGLDIIEATKQMDLEWVKACVANDADSIHKTDESGNNVMHICVLGGGSFRARHLMEYYLNETKVNLLHKNEFGQDPFDAAMWVDDEEACQLIEPHWNAQAIRRVEPEEKVSLKVVPSDNTPPKKKPEPT